MCCWALTYSCRVERRENGYGHPGRALQAPTGTVFTVLTGTGCNVKKEHRRRSLARISLL